MSISLTWFPQQIFYGFLLSVSNCYMYKLVKYRINSRLNAGFYTAFSASSLLYISLASEEDSTAEVKLLCSCEITMKLLVVYCWFNSFTYTILFRDEDTFISFLSFIQISYSQIHPGEPWLWSGYQGIPSVRQAVL